MNKLIVAEKDKAARRIAEILSDGTYESKKVGKTNVYEYSENGDQHQVVGLRGHIMKIDFPEQYKDWQAKEPEELIRADIEKKPLHKGIVNSIQKLAEKAEETIIATDYDREGELIGKDALEVIQKQQKDIKNKRARFSALTPTDVKQAFNETGEMDYLLSSSGEVRQILDLVWGASLTRYISLTAHRYGDNFLSVGRVQTPTLAIIVDKEKEIEAFEPTPYWEINIKLQTDKKPLQAQHTEGRIWDETKASEIYSKIQDTATVTQIKTKTRKDKPPTPFNTTAFMRAAGAVGLTPSRAMSTAESLYTAGYISYPRTDNTVYSESLDIHQKLDMLGTHPEFQENVQKIKQQKKIQPTRGDKTSKDHPPIHPTQLASKDDLSKTEWKVYELVVRRFLATLSPPATKQLVTIKLTSGGEKFHSKGTKYTDLGWRQHYPYYKTKETILPELQENQELKIKDKQKESKETNPPNRYSSNRLITEMDNKGLGTKATRHNIISKLYSRNYIYGDPPKPTKTAEAVIETLEKYAERITQPDMTATLEKEMDQIIEGELEKQEVIEESRQMLEDIFKDLTKNKEEIAESLRTGLQKDKIIGPCPDCGENLRIMRSRRGSRFVGCTGYPDCNYSLPLPKRGNLIRTKKTCPDHNLNKLKVTYNKDKKPWTLGCPQCNYDEWQENKNKEKNKEKTEKNNK
ncbi:DNA topoisomerase I [Methanonatronarchaeum sp. AMET6-2]|uniref:DNA topoisomerase I n=1 Tax=Methanonatronarchaeum sp. AMET6-2 TaxID=2933293 RepID=UPI0012261B0B|nr:DNA topoisomerase I [Methanonatronarchaeum sp. AMET6-2]RZN60866.1 MAG: DNA topoisomerase I [Methanonatronarchaeia archaeon]UOY09564.1 DNA topoisomerase I [Methanonatronarchaeum sp. AMET6-2]